MDRCRWLVAAVSAAGLAALAGCGPAPAPPTVVTANVTAATGANAGAPVAVRIYQLVSGSGFEGAQFFPLFDKDAATLGADLVKRDDLLLAPGQSKSVELKPEDRAHALGIFAAYRDYESAVWRAVVSIPAHQTSVLTVTADAKGVVAKIEPAKPK